METLEEPVVSSPQSRIHLMLMLLQCSTPWVTRLSNGATKPVLYVVPRVLPVDRPKTSLVLVSVTPRSSTPEGRPADSRQEAPPGQQQQSGRPPTAACPMPRSILFYYGMLLQTTLAIKWTRPMVEASRYISYVR